MTRHEPKYEFRIAPRDIIGFGAFRLGFLFLALSVFVPSSILAEEIDGLIAGVNGIAITQGDLELARSLNEVLLSGKDAAPASRREELDRLIDQELMRQELKNFSMMDEEENRIEARMQSLRSAFAAEGGLSALLRRVGLQEPELVSYIRLESSILRFVNFRFRPFVSVSAEEIRAYYENRLTPQLRESRIELPPLAQISGKIEAVLKEEKINSVLDQWMREIRRNSRIEYFDDGK